MVPQSEESEDVPSMQVTQLEQEAEGREEMNTAEHDRFKWVENMVNVPSTFKTQGGICWRTNGSNGEYGVLMLEGLPNIEAGNVLVDVENDLAMNVVRRAANEGLCVTPQYRSPAKWWQRLVSRVFRIPDQRDFPPCVKHGGTVVVLGELHYEGEGIPLAFGGSDERKK